MEKEIPINENSIEIDAGLLESISNRLQNCNAGDQQRQHSSSCSIYPVPPEIRSSNEDAYTPKVVCIGPYHDPGRTDSSYGEMQDYKWRCLNFFISRHSQTNKPYLRQALLRSCLMNMRNCEEQVRSCYSKEILLDSSSLAEMMMLDGCFVLHLLLRQPGNEFERLYRDEAVGRVSIWNLVNQDLLKLENQIPFFIVSNVRESLGTPKDMTVDLAIRALCLFADILPQLWLRVSSPEEFHHLLDLVYMSLLPHPAPEPYMAGPVTRPVTLTDESISVIALQRTLWIPCANELQKAGVQFKKSEETSNSLLDIGFSKGAMEIPPLQIFDDSKYLFANLIAFEQCDPKTNFDITVYAAFMDCLISNSDDARLLHLNGILINRMSADQDPVHFFSRICNQIRYGQDYNYLRRVFAEVNKYHGSRWHQWRAGLVRDYFSNPWTIFAVIASVVLFIFTFLQTFFTIFPYFKPRN